MKSTDASTESANPMVAELATQARNRYHSALSEGLSEQQAFEEIIDTILRTYAEAVGQ